DDPRHAEPHAEVAGARQGRRRIPVALGAGGHPRLAPVPDPRRTAPVPGRRALCGRRPVRRRSRSAFRPLAARRRRRRQLHDDGHVAELRAAMRKPEFDDVMNGFVRPDGPGAAVAARQGGEVVHSAGYGLANIEWGIPVDTETVFRIGSITKQFTAAAILKLAAEGKLGIDDPLERHLPDYPVGERRITLRHLLNHTSGIKSYTAMPVFAEVMRRDLPLAESIALFKDAPADFAPGERFLYNNSGYLLLGAVIEAASGKSYEAYLGEAFFAPLGLTRTSYLHNDPIVAKRASGYTLAPMLRNAAPLSMTLPHAAGAMGSTAEDLLAWELALRGGRVVAPTDYQAMTSPGQLNDGSPIQYGFGLMNQTY